MPAMYSIIKAIWFLGILVSPSSATKGWLYKIYNKCVYTILYTIHLVIHILISFCVLIVIKLSIGKESSVLLIDLLPEAANSGQDTTYPEWIIDTQHDRILFMTLSTADGSPLDEEQLQSLMVITLYTVKY